MALGAKIGDVYLRKDKSRCCAYWRPADGTAEVFLCAISLKVFSNHPHLRESFIKLATEAALNRERAMGSSVTLGSRATAEARP
jgi:hypothetical protein